MQQKYKDINSREAIVAVVATFKILNEAEIIDNNVELASLYENLKALVKKSIVCKNRTEFKTRGIVP